MKILNLYCCIGGNRKLWGNDHEITSVEIDPKMAEIYKDFFPTDKVVVGDAHQYLLEHFEEFDFIWSSPPCPSHSRVRKATTHQNKPIYPDMKLYEEILFLQGYFKGKWCVENVISWYKPFIVPYEIAKHYFWTNYFVRDLPKVNRGHDSSIEELQKIKGFDLSKYKNIDKRKTLRNLVEPETGLWLFKEAYKKKQTLF